MANIANKKDCLLIIFLTDTHTFNSKFNFRQQTETFNAQFSDNNELHSTKSELKTETLEPSAFTSFYLRIRRVSQNLIFVVPSIMLYSSKISPTRCNNCVFILRNGFTLHVSGDNLTHHQEYICCIWPQVSRLT